ncbi:Putative phenylalanine aminotransferase [Sulfitobacter sp. THAF37]|uniref:pyridoxal phosphate-dependent aminotransferase n=1 Tax=Sulfitobacter sp. THAF37 TaxID=2587855 RepID=UPI0012690121|nr:histidinol-phosphate transaminase [Sulfitobacter sp. THAF37]QFT58819.1 Putative phenylalanine aminotransferase [Sulfitobacter sp. THAF37]
MTATPRSYLEPLNLRGRISAPQPKGLPLVNLGFNELPYGPSPKVAAAIAQATAQVASYGTPLCDGLRDRLAQANGLDADRIICGNGSEELLDVIARNFVRPGDEVLISAYGYIQFQMVAARQGATLVKAPETDFTTNVDALLGAVTAQTRLVFLANPNNPTGTVLPLSELARLVEGMPPHVVVVLDLAYGEFTGLDHCADVHALADNRKNVIVTRTFSKAYGLAGLRCGWAHAPLAMMPSLYAARGMGSVNRLAQAAATAALADMEVVKARVAEIVSERDRVAAALAGIGIAALPSGTNFLLVRVDGRGAEAAEALVVHFFEDAGIIVSRTREAGLEDWLRFSLGTPDQNDLLLRSAQSFMGRLG